MGARIDLATAAFAAGVSRRTILRWAAAGRVHRGPDGRYDLTEVTTCRMRRRIVAAAARQRRPDGPARTETARDAPGARGTV